jgi:hypothetical protein
MKLHIYTDPICCFFQKTNPPLITILWLFEMSKIVYVISANVYIVVRYKRGKYTHGPCVLD